jgi:hypothetical protein
MDPYYQIHIVPISSVVGPRFMLSADLQQGPGGLMPSVTLETWDELAAALGSINIDAEHIDEARKKAHDKGEAFNIRNVCLTDEQLGKLGLKRE